MKKTVAVLFVAILLAVSTASAQPGAQPQTHTPSGEAIIFDLILGRPLGLVTVVAGTAIFIVGLPFTVPTGSVGSAADKLIADPFRFTFIRPVGQLSDDTYAPSK